MRNLKLALAIVSALAFSMLSAIAQTPNITGNTFQTGQPGKTVQGMVGMCVNASNVAVPCPSGTAGQATDITGLNGAPPSSTNPFPVALVGTNVNFSACNSGCSINTLAIAASSHASGASAGGLQTFSFFRAGSTFSGILNNVKWTWRTGTNLTAVTVYVFNKSPAASTCTDAVAISIGAADVPNLVPGSPFTLAPAVVGAGSTLSSGSIQSPISIRNVDTSPGQQLYICVGVNATVTPAANDGVLEVAGIQD